MNMRKIIGTAAVWGAFFFCMSLQAAAFEKVPLADYLEYARAAADLTWENYDNRVKTWKQKLDPENVFGYRPPGGLLEMSVIYAQLYAQEENPEYLKKAKFILMNYDDFRKYFPQWAVKARPDHDDSPPALPGFFTSCAISSPMIFSSTIILFFQRSRLKLNLFQFIRTALV